MYIINLIKKHSEQIKNITTLVILKYFYISSWYGIYLVLLNGASQHTPHKQIAILLGTAFMYEKAIKSKDKIIVFDYGMSFISNLVLLIVILIKS
jgi:hypothetical protein